MAQDDHKKRGFADLGKDERQEVASKGGKSQGAQNNPGNFANRDDATNVGSKSHENARSENEGNEQGNNG